MSDTPSPKNGRCADCPFWDHLGTIQPGVPVTPDAQAGICRRNAPRHIDWHPDAHDGTVEDQRLPNTLISGIRPGMFPQTRGNDWCGEHPFAAAFAAETRADFEEKFRARRRANAEVREAAERRVVRDAKRGA